MEANVNINPLDQIKTNIRNKPIEATKFQMYKTLLNPSLTVHLLYTERIFIPDYKRQAFTRLRLMSHSLKVETGRWSRIPPERRLCSCNANVVQNENHVMLECDLVDHLRTRYHMLNFASLSDLLESERKVELCEYIYNVLDCICTIIRWLCFLLQVKIRDYFSLGAANDADI